MQFSWELLAEIGTCPPIILWNRNKLQLKCPRGATGHQSSSLALPTAPYSFCGRHSHGRIDWLQIRICDLQWINLRGHHQAGYNFLQVKVSFNLGAVLCRLSCYDVHGCPIWDTDGPGRLEMAKGYVVWQSSM